jgi:chromosome partitioning protein
MADQIVIAVIGQKGGPGKTTTAAGLIGAAHLRGLKVKGLDLDAQGSLRDWSKARAKGSKLEGVEVEAHASPLTSPGFAKIRKGWDVIVMDGPPRLGDVTRAAAALASVIVVPVQSGKLEWWALSRTFDDLDLGAGVRRKAGLPPARLVFVLNRHKPTTKLGRDAIESINGIEGGELSPITIGDRVAYKDSVSKGESVESAFPGSIAAEEVFALWAFLTRGSK